MGKYYAIYGNAHLIDHLGPYAAPLIDNHVLTHLASGAPSGLTFCTIRLLERLKNEWFGIIYDLGEKYQTAYTKGVKAASV
jgi:hypothetical protein